MGARCCYLVERYLNVLKKYVRNKVQLEACMATGYMYDKALGFCTKYFALYPHTRHRMWDPNKEEANSSEVLERWVQFKRLSAIELKGIHDYIITNFVTIEGLYECVFHIN